MNRTSFRTFAAISLASALISCSKVPAAEAEKANIEVVVEEKPAPTISEPVQTVSAAPAAAIAPPETANGAVAGINQGAYQQKVADVIENNRQMEAGVETIIEQ